MKLRLAVAAVALSVVALPQAQAPRSPKSPTIEQFLSPAYPLDLTSAKKADRIAWVSYDEGQTQRLHRGGAGLSAGASHVVLEGRRHGHDRSESVGRRRDRGVRARPHAESRRVGRQSVERSGRRSERAIWAVRTAGGPAWRVAEGCAPELAPDGVVGAVRA